MVVVMIMKHSLLSITAIIHCSCAYWPGDQVTYIPYKDNLNFGHGNVSN